MRMILEKVEERQAREGQQRAKRRNQQREIPGVEHGQDDHRQRRQHELIHRHGDERPEEDVGPGMERERIDHWFSENRRAEVVEEVDLQDVP